MKNSKKLVLLAASLWVATALVAMEKPVCPLSEYLLVKKNNHLLTWLHVASSMKIIESETGFKVVDKNSEHTGVYNLNYYNRHNSCPYSPGVFESSIIVRSHDLLPIATKVTNKDETINKQIDNIAKMFISSEDSLHGNGTVSAHDGVEGEEYNKPTFHIFCKAEDTCHCGAYNFDTKRFEIEQFTYNDVGNGYFERIRKPIKNMVLEKNFSRISGLPLNIIKKHPRPKLLTPLIVYDDKENIKPTRSAHPNILANE